jgi:hypothetical protein
VRQIGRVTDDPGAMAHDDPDRSRALIAVAAERGIISAAQCDALGALQLELYGSPPARVEATRGVNSVNVAYAIGAMLVVFAFAWFLADRWQALGPWGVLVVGVVYACLLGGCSVWLERRGFRVAASVALMLAVTLAPVVTWSVQVFAGLWPVDAMSSWLDDSNRWMSVCWTIVDLATLLVALLAFRWRPGVALTIPMAIMVWGLGLHLSRAIAGDSLVGALDKWLWLANGLVVCLIAGEVDRSQVQAAVAGGAGDGDYAFFFWLIGLFTFAIAYLAIWAGAGVWRHGMVVVALILIAVSLFLRRRTHLVFGLLGLFGYLAFLALDVFKDFLSLPAVLATLGILLIVTTVWVQRRFPRLVERVNAGRAGAALPPMVSRGPFILAFGVALLSTLDMKDDVAQHAFGQRLRLLQRHSGSASVLRLGPRAPHQHGS